MNDIEQKALALLNEIKVERGKLVYYDVINRNHDVVHEALCRAIEQHEAFKQEVSDAVAKAIDHIKDGRSASAAGAIGAFVIRKPKPDPLVDVAARLGWDSDYVPVVRATLDFFDLEIREKGQ
jgi:hypothetical protein